MEAKAIARHVRVTPRKANQVLQLIRGKRVDVATEILDFTPKHVARVIGKVVKSAVANAVAMEGKINIEQLRVKEAVAGAGPTMKRFLPRAQGRATPLLKRTCHIRVIVEGDVHAEVPARRLRRTQAQAKTAPAMDAPVKEGAKAPAKAAGARKAAAAKAKPAKDEGGKSEKSAKGAKKGAGATKSKEAR
jgi:large subunit ribosomal protein L22